MKEEKDGKEKVGEGGGEERGGEVKVSGVSHKLSLSPRMTLRC